MLSKNKIKFIKSLSVSKLRREQKAFAVEGTKIAKELFSSNFQTLFVCATEDWINKHPQVIPANIDIVLTLPHEMEKISQLSTAPGILAVAEIPERDFFNDLGADNLYLALDGISDPGNMGTILRTADWFGINDVFCSLDSADAFNPKVVQASMGAVFRINVWPQPLDKLLRQATAEKIPVYGAMMSGENVYEMAAVKGGILVIGSESQGIRSELFPALNNHITIPRFERPEKSGQSESLNAAVATALILAEFRRKTS